METPKNRNENETNTVLRTDPSSRILFSTNTVLRTDPSSPIVTHSGFEKIPMSAETKHEFFREQLHELELAILEHKGSQSNRRIVKDLERAKKRLETKLK